MAPTGMRFWLPLLLLSCFSLATGCASSVGAGGDGLDLYSPTPNGQPDGQVTVVPCTSTEECLESFPELGPCLIPFCDAESGLCQTGPKKDASPCDDGNACTSATVCFAGECGGGEVTWCDDANPCTSESCDKQLGCLYTANLLGCDDGNSCTQGDSCLEGACVPGLAVACNDDNPCTDDVCRRLRL